MDNTVFGKILDKVVQDNTLHARWLNTLSMMENTGARKISASESQQGVTLMVLKHAAEEARHAYYLKKQIAKLEADPCPDYTYGHILAPTASSRYLYALDVQLSRYLKAELQLQGKELRYGAYLLVTYAIEVRADELYPQYQEVLKAHNSRVTVRSIILEEETHLAEMLLQMKEYFGKKWELYAAKAIILEENIFSNWLVSLQQELL